MKNLILLFVVVNVCLFTSCNKDNEIDCESFDYILDVQYRTAPLPVVSESNADESLFGIEAIVYSDGTMKTGHIFISEETGDTVRYQWLSDLWRFNEAGEMEAANSARNPPLYDAYAPYVSVNCETVTWLFYTMRRVD